MADWLPPYRSWAEEWRRNWAEVLFMSSAAAASLGMPQPGTLAGDPFGMLVAAARSWLVGKKRTFWFPGHELTLLLTDISVEGSDPARAVGQYGQVTVSARDIGWGGYQLERMEIRARNVHVRLGPRPVLVAAPVLCEALVPVRAVSRWLATVSPRLTLTLQAGVPLTRLAPARPALAAALPGLSRVPPGAARRHHAHLGGAPPTGQTAQLLAVRIRGSGTR